MARLRIRVELSRSGQGVPLQKLAHVIDESLKFFQSLGEDVGIGSKEGEWLGIDFDRDSLNFTAEFVGHVTAEQVQAFHSAFAGTTSLRRSTIAQFAQITESLNEEELVGFGLYESDDVNEPSEWRCISRRDALRISEEIALLAGDDANRDYGTHLPAVRDQNLVARIFGERHSRGLEHARWVDYVREIETNLNARLTNVENAVQKHTALLEDLHNRTATTEESFRNLLSAVENFCNQAAKQIERIPQISIPAPPPTPPPAPEPERYQVAAAAAAAGVASPQASAAAVAPEPARTYAATPVEPEHFRRETMPVTTYELPTKLPPSPKKTTIGASLASAFSEIPRNWLVVSAGAAIGCAAILVALWIWSIPTPVVIGPGPSAVNAASNPTATQAPASPTAQTNGIIPQVNLANLAKQTSPINAPLTPTAPPPSFASNATAPSGNPASLTPVPAPTENTVQSIAAAVQAATAAPQSPSPVSTSMLLDVSVTQPTWVALRDANNIQLLAQLMNPGESRTFRLNTSAVLRAGNAAGLDLKLNGKPVGPVGPPGGVREVEFVAGTFKIRPPTNPTANK
jgi:hypothetical protein